NAGIVKGIGNNEFGGGRDITRQELMVMTQRYLNYAWLDFGASSDAVKEFSDKNSIADWAKEPVDKMREMGLVKGDENGAFNPTDVATRAEVATIIVRLLELKKSFDTTPRIGDTSLSEYSLYSEYLTADELSQISDSIKGKTGVSLGVTDKTDGKVIVFGVDESLERLRYSVKEQDGKVYFRVSTKYAVPYFTDIIETIVNDNDHFVITEGFTGGGIFTLDEATLSAETFSFICETDKNPLSYNIGESCTFRVTLLSDYRKLVSVPQMKWIYEDDEKVTKSGIVDGHSGQLILTFDSLKAPGVVKINVELLNKKGTNLAVFEGGPCASVVYGFDEISTYTEVPDDFEKFWSDKLAELKTVEPEAISLTLCPDQRDGFTTYDAEIKSLNTVAYAHITVPNGAEVKSLPIYAKFDGYRSPMHDNPDYDSGAIVVSVNEHEVRNHGDSAYYSDYSSKICNSSIALNGVWAFSNPSREESYFLNMLMRDIQAIRFVETEFADLWNGKDIEVSGESMGGFQSIAVAAIYNEKVTVCNPLIPWMCDLGGITLGGKLTGWIPAYSEGAKYYDSTYFAKMFDGEVRIVAGLGDYTCPPGGIAALYNAYDCEKTLEFTQCMGHGVGVTVGIYNGVFTVSSNNTDIDEMKKDIIDTGCSVLVKPYDPDRTLNAAEEEMKAIASKLKLVNMSFATQPEMTQEAVAEILKEALVTKCGLDESMTIIPDGESRAAAAKILSWFEDGKNTFTTLEYTIKDQNGNYYEAKTQILLKKLPE
ncbi:MAG: acetylxylan esterase, partial [Clostridia bacterium]|nr:acetylxylan esterase [Clostridia bacterium]